MWHRMVLIAQEFTTIKGFVNFACFRFGKLGPRITNCYSFLFTWQLSRNWLFLISLPLTVSQAQRFCIRLDAVMLIPSIHLKEKWKYYNLANSVKHYVRSPPTNYGAPNAPSIWHTHTHSYNSDTK